MTKDPGWLVAVFVLVAVGLAACGPFGGGPAEKTVFVGPYLVDCVGVAPQKCMLVREDPEEDWTFFYDRIEGFQYEEGYEYELRVIEEKIKDPPADASSLRWTLVELLGKNRSLEGTDWVLSSYLNSQGVLVNVLPGTEATARFQEGNVAGIASCNNYFGTYGIRGDRLTVNLGGTTEMYCGPEELMTQEQDYLSALDSAASYLIAGDKLQIEDRAGNEVLTFSVLKPTALVGTLWQLTHYDNGTGGFSSVLRDTEITAQFGEDGKVGGSAGCNSYSGAYEIDSAAGAAGGVISIGPVASTMMMCPGSIMDQETAYLKALQSAATYEIEGRQLTMFNAEGQRVLAFTVSEPTPLTGSTWQLLGYNNGKQAVVSVVIGTEITAVFDDDGNMTGSAGCNSYTASYEVDEADGAITIGLAATTMMMCQQPEGIMEQESAYLAALQTAATYHIEGDRLQLRTAEGALAADYVRRAETPAGTEGAGLNEEALANMTYKSEWTQSGTALLTDGEYREQAAPGSATEIVVMLTEHVAYGTLDGQPSAVAVLVTDPGGSGTFYDLAVVVEQDGQPANVATTLLGDRVQINSVSIENNGITVDMVAHGPDDPMCCPTQHVVQTYALQGDQLVQTSSQVIGPGGD